MLYFILIRHMLNLSGRMLYGEKKYSSNHSFRRPYGCAGGCTIILIMSHLIVVLCLVFDILEILRGTIGGEAPESIYADEHHCFMPIFVWYY